ncbi:MAG: DNA gyrase inhibitor YacG [Proteobacteria bacterium]|nr:DNA gyrase inhibitor YacG [Pseudomonadota bacterium]
MAERVRPRARPCPLCGRPAVARFRPFCSRRCADGDLGKWIAGDYRIPTDEVPDLEEEEPGQEG